MYSHYIGNIYQPLRADIEWNGSQVHKGNNRKQIRKAINYSRPFLKGWRKEPLTLIDFNLENMGQCNIKFPDLYYFLEFLLVRRIYQL